MKAAQIWATCEQHHPEQILAAGRFICLSLSTGEDLFEFAVLFLIARSMACIRDEFGRAKAAIDD